LKSRKNIPLIYSLLLWAAVLCFSGYARAEQFRNFAESRYIGTPPEEVSAEAQSHAVALSEPMAPHATVIPTEFPLPLLVLAYGLSICCPDKFIRKLNKVSAGFSSLIGQFRILPNAP
jgi:hypothetical protein